MSTRGKADIRQQSIADAVEEHSGRLRSVINGLLRDSVETEDVLQDVYAEFVATYDLGTAIDTVGAWLMRVAQNKVLDRFRRRKTQEEYRVFVQTEKDDKIEPGNDWMRERFRDEIFMALALLPPEQRDVFVRHELEGQSFDEIAKETGVSVNTLLSRKRYAVQSLREYLKEIYDELE